MNEEEKNVKTKVFNALWSLPTTKWIIITVGLLAPIVIFRDELYKWAHDVIIHPLEWGLIAGLGLVVVVLAEYFKTKATRVKEREQEMIQRGRNSEALEKIAIAFDKLSESFERLSSQSDVHTNEHRQIGTILSNLNESVHAMASKLNSTD